MQILQKTVSSVKKMELWVIQTVHNCHAKFTYQQIIIHGFCCCCLFILCVCVCLVLDTFLQIDDMLCYNLYKTENSGKSNKASALFIENVY